MQQFPGAVIMPFKGIFPTIDPSAWLAPGVVVIGDVHIGPETNVWFGCVIRGDVNTIRIGARTNIQDNSTIHVTRKTGPTFIGSGVTIGHNALIHAATLEDGSFFGMGAAILDHAVVESGAYIAAGSLVTPNKRVPTGQMWAGNPAKYFRDLRPEEVAYIPESARHYVELAKEYKGL